MWRKCLIGGTPLTPWKVRHLRYLQFGPLNCRDVIFLQWTAALLCLQIYIYVIYMLWWTPVCFYCGINLLMFILNLFVYSFILLCSALIKPELVNNLEVLRYISIICTGHTWGCQFTKISGEWRIASWKISSFWKSTFNIKLLVQFP